MKLETYQFSEQEITLLKGYRDKQEDVRLQRRFLALLLIAEKVSLDVVKKVFDISDKTLERWFNAYRQKGIESLNSFNYQPKSSNLTPEEEAQLKDWVKKNPQETGKSSKPTFGKPLGVGIRFRESVN